MRLEEELNSDISQFFRQIESQLPENKKETLRLLIDKYCHISSVPIVFDRYDFDMISQAAHKFFLDSDLPKVVGEKKRIIQGNDLRTLSIIEGVITYLNSKDCLKKQPKFDYKEK